MNADVVQIKVAQGAKPGEGGQLPGDKVTVQIAQLRYSRARRDPDLPAAHHDIYSIEDWPSSSSTSADQPELPGVGEAGVRTWRRHHRLWRGQGLCGLHHRLRLRRRHGRQPLTSVKYAGSPWELGLAETQQALAANGLRHKVRLQVDGGLKTGLDIIKAAILGAESFGFGTGPMVALSVANTCASAT